MSKEVIFEKALQVPQFFEKVPSLSLGEGMEDTQKVIATLGLLITTVYSLYFASRSFEGSMNRWYEKAMTATGAGLVIAVTAVANYEIWK